MMLTSLALSTVLLFGESVSASPPNVLFILADDLGWNDVSWHNPEVISPNLDRLAREGFILENHYVQPTCGPSRTALMTGYYPIFTGGQFVPTQELEPVGLPTKFKLMPQYLKEAGYSTHLAGKWHLGYCCPEYQPTNRGFDSFRGLWGGAGDHNNHVTNADPREPITSAGYDFHSDEETNFSVIGKDTSTIIGDRFTEILSERAGLRKRFFRGYPKGPVHMKNYNTSNPFFMYAAFQDVHKPLMVDSHYEDMYPEETDPNRKTLLGMVSRLDATVGRMVEDLDRFSYLSHEGENRTLLQDTVIIFSSDNGGLSPGMGFTGGASNYPLKGRKGDTLEGGCKVPAFIYNSGRTGVTDELFHISDWLPTIVSGMAGIGDLPEDLNGVNQIQLITTESGKSGREEILYDMANFENTNHTLYVGGDRYFDLTGAFGAALRFQDFKLLLGCSTLLECARNMNESMGGNADNNRIELYNLVKDPVESNNLAEDLQYAEILEDLMIRLLSYRDQAAPPLHGEYDPSGLPANHFPPGLFHSGWCDPIQNPFLPYPKILE